MAWRVTGGVLVIAHGPTPPSEREWKEHCQFVDKRIDGLSGVIVVSEGGHPNSLQRAELAAVMDKRDSPPTSLVTTSRTIRGVMSVMRWLSVVKDVKTFPPDRVHEAFEFLGVPSSHAKRLRRDLEAMQAQIAFAQPPPTEDK